MWGLCVGIFGGSVLRLVVFALSRDIPVGSHIELVKSSMAFNRLVENSFQRRVGNLSSRDDHLPPVVNAALDYFVFSRSRPKELLWIVLLVVDLVMVFLFLRLTHTWRKICTSSLKDTGGGFLFPSSLVPLTYFLNPWCVAAHSVELSLQPLGSCALLSALYFASTRRPTLAAFGIAVTFLLVLYYFWCYGRSSVEFDVIKLSSSLLF